MVSCFQGGFHGSFRFGSDQAARNEKNRSQAKSQWRAFGFRLRCIASAPAAMPLRKTGEARVFSCGFKRSCQREAAPAPQGLASCRQPGRIKNRSEFERAKPGFAPFPLGPIAMNRGAKICLFLRLAPPGEGSPHAAPGAACMRPSRTGCKQIFRTMQERQILMKQPIQSMAETRAYPACPGPSTK